MATVKGTSSNLPFGVSNGVAATGTGVAVQSYSQAKGINTKELKNKNGQVISVAFFRKTEEISVDLVGTPSNLAVGGALAATLQNASSPSDGGSVECIIDEITIDKANEDFLKTSIRATTYGL